MMPQNIFFYKLNNVHLKFLQFQGVYGESSIKSACMIVENTKVKHK